MARKLRVEIEGDSKSGRKALDDVADQSDKAARQIDNLGGEFRQAAKDADLLEKGLKGSRESVFVLGKDADKAAGKVDNLGGELSDAAKAAAKLDGQLAVTRTELAKLNKEFNEGGDPEVLKQIQKQYAEIDRVSRLKRRLQRDDEDALKRADPLRQIERQYAELDRVARLKKRIAKDDEDAQRRASASARDAFAESVKAAKGASGFLRRLWFGGKEGASAGGAALSSVPTGGPALGGAGLGALAGVGAAAAPGLGGAVGGAALAGGALAGVGLGVAGAIANNPEPFRQAWTSAIQEISKRWQAASAGFEKPSLDAFATIKNAIDGIDLEGPLKDAEKYVEPLARGIGGLISGIGKGFGGLISKAGPVVDVLAKRLPEIGKAFDIAFNRIGDSSEGAAAALDDVLRIVRNVVVGVGDVVGFLSDVYGKSVEIRKNVSGFVGIDLFGDQDSMLQTYARTIDGATTSTLDMAQAQKNMAQAAKDARDALRNELDELLGLEGANDAAIVAMQNLKKSFDENGKSLEGNSEKALNNRAALRDLEQAYQTQWEKAVEAAHGSEGAIRDANAAYLAHLQEVRAIAVAHGGNTTELDKYIEHLKRVNGLTTDFYIYTHFINVGTPNERRTTGESRAGGQANYAAGGVMDTSGFKLVGEQGPEIVWGSQGQFVSTAEQTKRLVSQMSGGGASGSGQASGQLTLVAGSGYGSNPLVELMMQALWSGQLQMFDSTGAQIRARP